MQRSAAAMPPAAAPMPAPMAAPSQYPEQPVAAQGGFDPNAMDPGNTNNLLQLARRLHEEHVREGMEKRDALIAEGHATAARVVSEAEQGARAQLGSLQQERQELERKVEELRHFEREYRTKLRGYIEGQLRELESSNALTAAPAGQQAAATPQQAAPQYVPAAPVGYGQPQQQDYAQQYPTDYPGFGPAN